MTATIHQITSRPADLEAWAASRTDREAARDAEYQRCAVAVAAAAQLMFDGVPPVDPEHADEAAFLQAVVLAVAAALTMPGEYTAYVLADCARRACTNPTDLALHLINEAVIGVAALAASSPVISSQPTYVLQSAFDHGAGLRAADRLHSMTDRAGCEHEGSNHDRA